MAERFPFGFAPNMNDNILYHALARPLQFPTAPPPPLSPRKQRIPSDRPASRPGREAAKRTLDGEDRSDTMKREGKGGLFQAFPQG